MPTAKKTDNPNKQPKTKCYIELFELDLDFVTGDERWEEKGRWMKYEETPEGKDNHWSRPRVPCIHTQSLLKLRDLIKDGAIMLDLAAGSVEEMQTQMKQRLKEQLDIEEGPALSIVNSFVKTRKHVSETAEAQDPSMMLRKLSRAVFASNNSASTMLNSDEGGKRRNTATAISFTNGNSDHQKRASLPTSLRAPSQAGKSLGVLAEEDEEEEEEDGEGKKQLPSNKEREDESDAGAGDSVTKKPQENVVSSDSDTGRTKSPTPASSSGDEESRVRFNMIQPDNKAPPTSPTAGSVLSNFALNAQAAQGPPVTKAPGSSGGPKVTRKLSAAFQLMIAADGDEEAIRNFQEIQNEQLTVALGKKIPDGSEAVQVYSGIVGGIPEPTLGMIRFMEGVEFKEMLKAPIPMRFLFFVLGPPNHKMDYHQIGRVISTLMSTPFTVHPAIEEKNGKVDSA